jgi:arylsulfatase A-like enzyme
VVVTADHGEAFFEHGEKGHRNTLYEELVRVPLLIRYPALIAAGRIVTEPVRLMDVAPTVLSLVGVDVPERFAYTSPEPRHAAADLSPVVTGTRADAPPLTALSQLDDRLVALRSGRRKLIRHLDGSRRVEVYDLAVDPRETANLAATRPVWTDALMALRALGYLE